MAVVVAVDNVPNKLAFYNLELAGFLFMDELKQIICHGK